jgi:hypothetical protein
MIYPPLNDKFWADMDQLREELKQMAPAEADALLREAWAQAEAEVEAMRASGMTKEEIDRAVAARTGHFASADSVCTEEDVAKGVQWFGVSWEKPDRVSVCVADQRIDTPVGELCYCCSQEITDTDSGIRWCQQAEACYCHRDCVLDQVCGSVGKIGDSVVFGRTDDSCA